MKTAIGFFCLLLGLAGVSSAQAADLGVTVSGIRDGEGDIRVVLYDTPQAFRHEDQAVAIQTVAANAGSIHVNFADLVPGRYALIAYHDANRNGKLDLFMGMFPAEGWGMTNDPAVLGPPKFDPAAILLDQALEVVIGLHY